MSDAALASQIPEAAADAVAADLRARAVFDQQMWTLGRLAQAGLNMALALEAQALAAHPDAAGDQGPQPYGAPTPAPVSLDFALPDPGQLALAFTRVSRAVRMTLALQARLLKAGDGGAHAMASKAPSPPPAETRKQRVDRAGAILRRLIATGEGDAFEAMDMMERATERLSDPDITGELLDRSLPDLIAAICRDLGLSPDRAELEGEAWMREGAAQPPLFPPACGRVVAPATGWETREKTVSPTRPSCARPPSPSGREVGLAAGP
jgi:hypothetical protein